MPDYKVHQIAGIVLLLIAAVIAFFFKLYNFKNMNILDIILIVFVTLFYSILPDIDTEASKAKTTIETWSYILIAGLGSYLLFMKFTSEIADKTTIIIIATIVLIAVILLLVKSLKHRGPTHTFVAATLFSLPLIYFSVILFVAGVISYTSHLIIDGEFKIYGKARKT